MSQHQDISSIERGDSRPVIVNAELSHGTLESIDLKRARPLYEKVFGLRVVRHSKIGQLIGGRSEFVAVSIAAGSTFAAQTSENRWLVLLAEGDDLEARYALAKEALSESLLKELRPITESRGAQSFTAQDLDGNWWEISNLSYQYFQSRYD